jgi:integrase
MFTLAIDSKLRGCDVVALKIEDVEPSGYSVDRATVRQKKTGRPVRFELTDTTRQAADDYLRTAPKKPGDFLFPGRRLGCGMTTGQYARLPDAIQDFGKSGVMRMLPQTGHLLIPIARVRGLR